jgi:capsular polysaccharide biosynthesis protein
MQGFDREEVHPMLVSTRPAQAVEAPSRLQLAIREWQRQLIAMAEAAQSGRATDSATAGG